MTTSSHHRVERAWIVGNLAYAAVRIALARQFLADHGLNIWAFAFVEVSSSVPWSVGSARFTVAAATRRGAAAARWAAVASAGFLAPDAFVLTTTHRVPPWLYAAIGTWIAVAAGLAVHRLNGAVRSWRAAGGAPRTPTGSRPSLR